MKTKNSRIKIKHFGVWSINTYSFLIWLKNEIEGDNNFGRALHETFCYGDLSKAFKLVSKSSKNKDDSDKDWDFYLEKMTIKDVIQLYIELADQIGEKEKAIDMRLYHQRMNPDYYEDKCHQCGEQLNHGKFSECDKCIDENELWKEANKLYNLKEHTQDGRDLQMKNFKILKR